MLHTRKSAKEPSTKREALASRAGPKLQQTREGVHLVVNLDIQTDEVTLPVANLVVFHAGISPTSALELIKEIGDDLPQAMQLRESL